MIYFPAILTKNSFCCCLYTLLYANLSTNFVDMNMLLLTATVFIFILIQDFLGKSDPYLELARSREDGSFVVVHRTEVSLFIICDKYIC